MLDKPKTSYELGQTLSEILEEYTQTVHASRTKKLSDPFKYSFVIVNNNYSWIIRAERKELNHGRD